MPLVEPFSAVSASLRKALVIPDVLPETFTPSAFVTITLPGVGLIELGAEVPLAQTVEQPHIRIVAAPSDSDVTLDGLVKNETKYTLAMLDPDAPSAAQPTSRHFRHWVITGLIPSNDLVAPAVQTALSANAYRPPGPVKGSGLHRYTFVLFREPPNFTLPADSSELDPSIEARRRWSPVEFAQRNNLEIIGATFYLVRSEE
ncbi:PEBP-like protein [Mycena amicta]|nr:PEBP-like protein [Mycena amicta]